jgi:hypothetical protein
VALAGEGGTEQALKAQTKVWGDLWQASGSDTATAAKNHLITSIPAEPPPLISVQELREVASFFPPNAACVDGVPIRAFAGLSDEALRSLSSQAQKWEASTKWPKSEEAVCTVLLPKPQGGLRPIALFRSVIRMVAKLRTRTIRQRAQQANNQRNNLQAGRQVGDAMWRTQLRAHVAHGKGQGTREVMLDFKKACEHVHRGKLIEVALKLGFPVGALRLAVAKYSWQRRLNYEGRVSEPAWPTRGIAAGAASATFELWVRLAATLQRFSMVPGVAISAHVDDLSVTAAAKGEAQLVRLAVEQTRAIQTALTSELGLVVADETSAVVASSSEVASRVGHELGIAEAGKAAAKRLGIDNALIKPKGRLPGVQKDGRGSSTASNRHQPVESAGARRPNVGDACKRRNCEEGTCGLQLLPRLHVMASTAYREI